MEFKEEELVEREIETGGYLMQDFSLKGIAVKTGLNKKLLVAHFRNMMEKLNVADMDELTKLIKAREHWKYIFIFNMPKQTSARYKKLKQNIIIRAFKIILSKM